MYPASPITSSGIAATLASYTFTTQEAYNIALRNLALSDPHCLSKFEQNSDFVLKTARIFQGFHLITTMFTAAL